MWHKARTIQTGLTVAMLSCLAATATAATVPGDYPTIQAAINAVVAGSLPDGTVINVQAGVYAEALTINATSKSMAIRGAGPGQTIVNASSASRSALRIISSSGSVSIEGMTITGGVGVPGNGGGFTFQDASPFINNVVFENNSGVDGGGGVLTRSDAQFAGSIIRTNTAARFGGGVVITTGSRPTFTNCQIRDNASGTGASGTGNIGSGGGVHVNDASPTFRGSIITGNQSKFAGGGVFIIGLFNSSYGTARLLLEDTEVSNNVSARFSSSENPAEGGGVHVEDNTVAYLIRSRVAGNTANTGGGLNGYRARYEITSSTIEGNHAQDPQAVGGFGGGIGMTSNNISTPLQQASSVVLVDSVVRNNDSRVGGGMLVSGDQMCGSTTPMCSPGTAPRASLQIVNSLVDGNSAALQSGGLRLDRTDATIGGSLVMRNSVAASGQSYGGGVLIALGATLTIQNSTVARNSAVNFGGGLFVDDAATLNMSAVNVYANTAASGGGLYVGSNGPPSGTVQNSTIADNTTYQIHEQACGSLQRTILTYQSNTVTPQSGQSDLYFSTCGGATSSISGFNSLPSGRASANTSSAPSFIAYLGVPAYAPSVLGWSVSRASAVSIAGVGSFNGDTGTTNVTPAANASYTLTNTGGPAGSPSRLVIAPPAWGGAGDTPVIGDFDGDGKTDIAVYRGSTGQWFIVGSSSGLWTPTWGAPSLGDVPVPADYDGDGRTDVAVFRMSTGQWFILRSSGGTQVVTWGAPAFGDVPVPKDYDGDGKADVAVYRRSTGEWFISKSTGGTQALTWGAPAYGDIPVPADYDGDHKADIAVYRSTTGQWFIAKSSGGSISTTWGAPSLGDTPVPADYDGDGKADIAVARRLTGEWFVQQSSGGTTVESLGYGDYRVPGDFDGNGRADKAVWIGAFGKWVFHP
jgi:hypothetical protein